jgi:hypothetical protein
LPTVILLTAALALGTAQAAPAELLQWQGSLKSLGISSRPAPANSGPAYRVLSNRLRLAIDWRPTPDWQLETAIDGRTLWRDPATALSSPPDDPNRHFELSREWQHGEHGTSRLRLDRLKLAWRNTDFDVTIGRQAIGFGRILVYSPLDVIAPFAPDAIDTDVRDGVDALRVAGHYGLDGELAAIAVWGDESRHDSLLATWSDNRAGLDLLLIGGQLRGRAMLGAGLAGNLGPLGLKLEASVFRGRNLNQPNGDRERSYTLAALEGWYRFDNGLSLVAEYLYNGPGASTPDDYPSVQLSAPLQEGLTDLLGRHYLILAPSYELHPLVTLQGLLLCNLSDDSQLLRPLLEISLADNLSLQLFYAWYSGDAPDSSSPLLPPLPRSEFGSRGDGGGLFLQWFF